MASKNKTSPVALCREFAFGETVRQVVKDSLLTLEELTGAKDDSEVERDDKGRVIAKKLPDGCTVVEGLNGHLIYSDERLERHKDTIAQVLKEFNAVFWRPNGATIMDLRFDYKGRTWADDSTLLSLCYVAIAMGLALWSKDRTHWSKMKSGMPMIKFICPKREEDKNGKTKKSS